jgi:hypothetical protein
MHMSNRSDRFRPSLLLRDSLSSAPGPAVLNSFKIVVLRWTPIHVSVPQCESVSVITNFWIMY